MDNRDTLTWRLLEVEGLGKNLLIGGILFYIPILNLLLLGYWGLWVRRLLEKRASVLPDWADWQAVLRETGRLLPVFLVIGVLPVAIAGLLIWGVGGLFELLSLEMLSSSVAWVPLSLVGILVPPALLLSVMRIHRGESLSASLNFADLLRILFGRLRSLLLPLLQFYGVIFVGWPVLGFAAFLGTMILLGHLVVALRSAEADLKSGRI